MPPKMFTSTPLTRGSERMIRNASMAPSGVTEPPTSRKFAGSPPWYLMMSIVLIARPAPLTRQPMFSRQTDVGQSGAAGAKLGRVLFRLVEQFRDGGMCGTSRVSSKVILASSAMTSPSFVVTSGLTLGQGAILVEVDAGHRRHERLGLRSLLGGESQVKGKAAGLERADGPASGLNGAFKINSGVFLGDLFNIHAALGRRHQHRQARARPARCPGTTRGLYQSPLPPATSTPSALPAPSAW